MNKRLTIYSIFILFIFFGSVNLFAQKFSKTNKVEKKSVSLEQVLNSDGTLNFEKFKEARKTGKIDFKGWKVNKNENGQPKFVKRENLQSVPGKTLVDGDQNWDDFFGKHLELPVSAIATSGSTIYIGLDLNYYKTIKTNSIQRDDIVFSAVMKCDSVKATFDVDNWQIVGERLEGTVNSIIIHNGTIYIGGDFYPYSNLSLNKTDATRRGISVAKLNGTSWDPLGYSSWDGPGTVYAMTVIGNILYVGGEFSRITKDDPVNIRINKSSIFYNFNNLAKKDLSDATAEWALVGNGVTYDGDGSASVYALAATASGDDLYVGGVFNWAPSSTPDYAVAVYNIAKVDTASEQFFPLGPTDGYNGVSDWGDVRTIAISGNNVYVGGYFSNVYDNNGTSRESYNFAVWDVSEESWNSFLDYSSNNSSISVDGNVNSIIINNNDAYIGGYFYSSDIENGPIEEKIELHHIAKWSSTKHRFYNLGSGLNEVDAPPELNSIQTNWDNDPCNALAINNGFLYCGGDLYSTGDKTSSNMGRWRITDETTSGGISIASNLAFGKIPVNSCDNQTLTITNNGDTPLELSSLSIADPTEFTITPSVATPFTIPANGSKVITVKFCPLSVGLKNTNLNLTIKDQLNPLVIPVSGEGIPSTDIYVTPDPLDFGDTKVLTTNYKTVTIENHGQNVLQISNVSTTDPDFFLVGGLTSLSKKNVINSIKWTPVDIAVGGNLVVTIGFNPKTVGAKTAKLNIWHNASNKTSPYEVSLLGNAKLSLSKIVVATDFDFKSRFYLTPPKDSTLLIKNPSTDYLVIESASFDNIDNIFQILCPFPIFIAPNDSYKLPLRFNPVKKVPGSLITNKLHLFNNSLDNPNAVVNVKGTIIEGNLIIEPEPPLDFGTTTMEKPDSTIRVKLTNSQAEPIKLSDVIIDGDQLSFDIENKAGSLKTINAGDSAIISIKFFPHTSGRKNATLVIVTDYKDAPVRYMAMTGVGGQNPVISVVPDSVDFGDIARNEVREATIIVKNIGNLDLYIYGRELAGIDKDVFAFIIKGKKDTLLHEITIDTIKIKITGSIPVGKKEALLIIRSNDPTNSIVTVKLTANVKSIVLTKSIDKIIFDTTVVGESRDTTFVLKNSGNLSLKITNILGDGAHTQDFIFSGITFPCTLESNDEKTVSLKFKPNASGVRFARLLITSDDPINPEQVIVLRGYGKICNPLIITVDTLDFGKTATNQTVNMKLNILNNSLCSKLFIDSIYFTLADDQPFSFGTLQFPLTIGPNGSYFLNITFNPKGAQLAYFIKLYIKTNDPLNPVKMILLMGNAGNQGAIVNLPNVLKFGKVPKDSLKTVSFEIYYVGKTFLQIDNIKLSGSNADEFTVGQKTYPVRISPDEKEIVFVSFKPKTLGTKEANLKITWNDMYNPGEIVIWAEGVLGSSQTLDVANNEKPTAYSLKQNYPNPFNPSTRISYSLPEDAYVTIKIFNNLGQEVGSLVNRQQPSGFYSLDWHAENLPSGIYFYRMQTEKFTEMKKMMFIR